MNCQKCNSERLLEIQGKTSDCFGMWQGDREYSGYVPDDMGIGGGDDIEFTYCLDCGQIQGEFPVFGRDPFSPLVGRKAFSSECLPDGGGKYRFVKKT